MLYRDLAYFNGPLSPLWHAMLFRLAGTSLTTLCLANLTALAALTGVMYGWIVRHFDRLTAMTACLVFLPLFGFAHLIAVGNYNFVTPYSHELTHGLMLAVMIFALLTAGGITRRRMVLSGVLWGGVFLGKPEVFVASTAMIVVLLVGRYGLRQRSRQDTVLDGANLLLSAVVVAGGFALYFSSQMPWQQALLSISGAWQFLAASDAAESPFYRALAGFDDPLRSVVRVCISVLAVGTLLGALALLRRWRQFHRGYLLCLAMLLLAFSLALRHKLVPWVLIPECLLAFCTVIATIFALRLLSRQRGNPERLLFGLAWSVFAAVMLGKMLLGPRFHHYGFALAMPATMLFVVCLVGDLSHSERLIKRPAAGMLFRYVLVGLLLFDAAFYWAQSAHLLRLKTYAVGRGQDVIFGFDRSVSPIAATFDTLLAYLHHHVPPTASMAVVPEGVMLNYLARRVNPTGHINLMPPELAMFGESHILASYRRTPPDYIVVLHKDTAEYGVPFFGQGDYGALIMSWIQSEYEAVVTFGAQPLVDDRFGAKLLRRISIP